LPIEQHETLTAESALEEDVFLGLRQLDGIDLRESSGTMAWRLTARFDPLASLVWWSERAVWCGWRREG